MFMVQFHLMIMTIWDMSMLCRDSMGWHGECYSILGWSFLFSWCIHMNDSLCWLYLRDCKCVEDLPGTCMIGDCVNGYLINSNYAMIYVKCNGSDHFTIPPTASPPHFPWLLTFYHMKERRNLVAIVMYDLICHSNVMKYWVQKIY